VNAANGVVAESFTYDEFGNLLTGTTGSTLTPFGFAGGLFDPATGLIHFGAREYDPRVGRWTGKDPIGFGGGDINLYTYNLGDPVGYIDPSGLSGMLTIYSSDNTSSSAPGWDGHAWIVYKPDAGTAHSFGTFGPMVAAPRGLNMDWELTNWASYGNRTGAYAVASRTMWIDDAHERALMQVVDRYQRAGELAWTSDNACTGFARESWFAATGERLYDSRGDSYGNPSRLVESITKLNGGIGARVARRKPR
jgi:RHS repeat-associated protein